MPGSLTGQSAVAASATLTGLSPNTIYHFRVLAENKADTTYGADQSFRTLAADTLFTRITAGAVADEGRKSWGGSWGDYDNDGDLDLFVPNDSTLDDFLYRNNNGLTFTKMTAAEVGAIVDDDKDSYGGSWGDYDNDGDPDLIVFVEPENNRLYRNESGRFTNVAVFDIGRDSRGGSWGDYDNDGYLDLFLANKNDQNNSLYKNNGGGSFTRILTGPIVNEGGDSHSGSWGDFDNDGDLDLFVANASNSGNFFYENIGTGNFRKITTGDIVADRGNSRGGSWGDYDNDGDLDLFVTNASEQSNFLYRNNGNGTFTKIASGAIVNDRGSFVGSAWGDYNNDGHLDLFVANGSGKDLLYHNNGNGTFTKVTAGSVVSDTSNGIGSSWADYDRDGDLDLFVANYNGKNFLYQNLGNGNNWINLRCLGTSSNKSAIGAKIRLKAMIGGKAFWQMQEISGQAGFGSQNSLNVEFGLGDAAIIDSIKVEWPSGARQIMVNAAANQFLSITEPANQSPVVVNPIPNQTLSVGDASFIRNLNAPPFVFNDLDGDVLTYSASSNAVNVATANVAGSTLTVAPIAAGSATITVTANDGKGGVVSTTFGVTVTNPQNDMSAPQISHTPVSVTTFGQSLTIAAMITDNVGVQSAMLFFRTGGSSSYDSTAMARASGDNYQAAIPSSFNTASGIEYSISARDGAGNHATVPATNPRGRPLVVQVLLGNLTFTKPTPAKAYRMISIPFDLDDKSPLNVLGDDLGGVYDDKQWRLLRYANGVNVEFGTAGFANFTPGLGFWLITLESKLLDAGAGRSVSTAQNHIITLPSGWSQIGNPFAFTVNWSEVIKGANVDNRLVGYQGARNEPTGYDYTRTQLLPFEGYFVNNRGSSPTTIEIPPKAASGSAIAKRLPDGPSGLRGNEWTLQITAACDRYLDKDNYLGALNDASDEWDRNDFSEAPFFDQHVALYFPHPEWKKYPDLYTGDFRETKAEGDYWDFVVRSEVAKSEVARSEVVLRLADAQNVPAEWEIILLDKASRVAINFSEKKQYSFPSGNGKTVREFRIVVGKKDFVETNDLNLAGVPQAFALGQNYPNPFNPSTRIDYELPFTNHVRISVYNLNGQLVQTLFDGEQSAGRYTVAWDGVNAAGVRAASGVYLVRMEGGPSAGSESTSSEQRFVAVRKAVFAK